jgi:error-prone DNA polymerase
LEDYRALSLTLRQHPLSFLRARLTLQGILPAAALAQRSTGDRLRVCGLVTGRQRPDTASGVVFVTLEDETGSVNVIVWNRVATRDRQALLGSRLLVVQGEVQHEHGVCHIIASKLVDQSDLLGVLEARSRDFH